MTRARTDPLVGACDGSPDPLAGDLFEVDRGPDPVEFFMEPECIDLFMDFTPAAEPALDR